MKKQKFTVSQAGYLLAVRIIWLEMGYLTLFNSKASTYEHELCEFIRTHKTGIKNHQVDAYLKSIPTIMSKAHSHGNHATAREILCLVPNVEMHIGYYDLLLRIQKGYCMGSARKLKSFLVTEKTRIVEILNMEDELFDSLLLQLFPSKVPEQA